MSNCWFTSDLHLGHQNIIKYCNRPYDSVDEMNEDIIRRINSLVGNDDDLYIVGDVCMGKIDKSLELIKRINGYKTLVAGNHDRIWDELDDDLYLADPERTHWHDTYVEAGFDFIVGRIPILIGHSIVDICHLPYLGISEAERHDDKHDARKPKDDGLWLLHGHVHGKWRQRGRMIDVGVDAWGGRPVHIDEIEALMEDGEQELEPIPWVR